MSLRLSHWAIETSGSPWIRECSAISIMFFPIPLRNKESVVAVGNTGRVGKLGKGYVHIEVRMHVFHRSAHGSERAAHQRLRTIELYLSNNAVRLEIGSPKAWAPVSNGINVRPKIGGYNECERRPSNTILGSVPTGGSFEIAWPTIIRFPGALANRA